MFMHTASTPPPTNTTGTMLLLHPCFVTPHQRNLLLCLCNLLHPCFATPNTFTLYPSSLFMQPSPPLLLHRCFSDYNIQKEPTLHLVLRLRGGAKKRKKKTCTMSKKIKHKHKKVKLSVLQFYKVDDSGKVQRSRKETIVTNTTGMIQPKPFSFFP